MGTRGLVGFYKKKVSKASYNHYDSYPSYTGEMVRDFITESGVSKLNKYFDRLKLVNQDDEVTPEHIISSFNFWYGDVDKVEYAFETMYDMLSFSHTDIKSCAEKGLINDDITFIKDSLFCEWAYIINLDSEILEVYRGFQHVNPKKNRYSMTKDEIAEIRAKLASEGKGDWYSYRDAETGKVTRHFHKNYAYYNCDLIAQIPLEMVPGFDMTLFGELIRQAENKEKDYVCGNILDLKYDFSPEVVRSTTLPMILTVLGI